MKLFFLLSFWIISCFAKGNLGYIVPNCDNTGRKDSALCLQNAIEQSAINSQSLKLNRGTYLVSQSIKLQSNVKIIGNGAMLMPRFTKPWQAVLIGSNLKNLNIKKLNIKGNGTFQSVKYSNPYAKLHEPSYAIGFNNLDMGISLTGNLADINIISCNFSGLDHGINLEGDSLQSRSLSQRIKIEYNTFENIGTSAIRLVHIANAKIDNNSIKDVSGNMTIGANPNIIDAKFADGIYVTGLQNSVISNNKISNIKRSGIVLEGEWDTTKNKVVVPNDNVKIVGNVITNVNGSRGTEGNAAVWIEGDMTSSGEPIIKTLSVAINNNIANNKGAMAGNNGQYGIISGAQKSIVQNNKISNFDNKNSYGIVCSFNCTLLDNKFMNNLANWGHFDNALRKIVIQN